MGNSCQSCDRDEERTDELLELTPRQRLLALFGIYAPHRLRDVDDILTAYQGKEWKALAYYSSLLGPEPTPRDAWQMYSTHLTTNDITLRREVFEILAERDPGFLPDVETIVCRFRGTSDQLVKALREGYPTNKDEHNLVNNNKNGTSLPKKSAVIPLTTPPSVPLREDALRNEALIDGNSKTPPFIPPPSTSTRPGHLVTEQRNCSGVCVNLNDFNALLAHSREKDLTILGPYRPQIS